MGSRTKVICTLGKCAYLGFAGSPTSAYFALELRNPTEKYYKYPAFCAMYYFKVLNFEGQPELHYQLLALALQKLAGFCLEMNCIQNRHVVRKRNPRLDLGHCSYIVNSGLLTAGTESIHLFQINHQKGIKKKKKVITY